MSEKPLTEKTRTFVVSLRTQERFAALKAHHAADGLRLNDQQLFDLAMADSCQLRGIEPRAEPGEGVR